MAPISKPAAPPERGIPLVQTIVLAILFAAPALFCVRAANIQDPDVWWHLRTAEWILAHHAVPFADPFSAPADGEPWAAYSWLFELVLQRFHSAAGLTGIIVYAAVMVLAITVATHRMVRRLQRDFSLVILITYTALFSMGEMFTPRPWLFTILFFVLELDLIFTARRTGRALPLLWLLPLFAVWANLHIQLLDGLIVLGIALTECAATALLKRKSTISPLTWAALLLASVTAVCVNPYGWTLYRTAYDLAAQGGVLNKINELAAMPFRGLVNYAVLALALAAAAVLARAPRILIFESLLLAFALYTGFRSQRDVWLIAISAAAIIAQGVKGSAEAPDRTPAYAPFFAAAVAFAAIFAAFPLLEITESKLAVDLAKAMPVRAVAFARANGLTGPLFNDFTWGGFLIWQLRQPVALDGRAALYGDARIDRNTATIDGQPGWQIDPTLAPARLIILSPKQPLAQLLRFDHRFKLVFEDATADIFVATDVAADNAY